MIYLRKLLLAVSLWVCIQHLAFAGLEGGIVWDVRTGGSDLNGGGYAGSITPTCAGTGTDYSVSDTPHVTFDGSTITASGTTSTITITGYTVASGDKCNLLNIASGTNYTAGIYEITSVNVGSSTWTLDRSPVSSGTASALVGRMGGGFVTPTQAFTSWTANGHDQIYIQSGTYSKTTTITPATMNGQSALMNLVEGYATSHGDMGTAPLITSATNSVHLFTLSNTFNGVYFRNIKFSSTAGTRGDGFRANNANVLGVTFEKCQFDGLHTALYGDFAVVWSFQGLILYNTEVKNSTSHGVVNGNTTIFIDSRIHDNAGDGFNWGTGDQAHSVHLAINSIFDHNTGNGMLAHAASNGEIAGAYHSVFSDNTSGGTADGFQSAPGSGISQLIDVGNIAYANTSYGMDASTTSVLNVYAGSQQGDAFGSNGTATRRGMTAGVSDITGISDPFVARGTNNFALAASATTLIQTAFPGALFSGGTGHSSFGALEPAAAASGSGSFGVVH